MIKILIVDDHEVVREGLKGILSKSSDITVADEAVDGQEAFDKIHKKKFDVVLLDISMPGRSGLEILKDIKIQKPELPVIILSIHPEERYAVRSLKSGASGYLTKESARDELIEAIREASEGRKYVTSSLAQKLASELEVDTDKPIHEILSDREFDVLCNIASGGTVKEIARKMSLSPNTISTYRSRILEKMCMKTNAELTRYAIHHKLIDS
jgi:DNA-binding NarL/FixJ family response regulator